MVAPVLGPRRPRRFFDTGSDHEALIVRPRSLFDSAVPCGTSVAADVLFRLAVLTGEAGYERTALAAIRPVAPLMQRYPSGFGRFLSALDFHLGPPVEVALVWPAGRVRRRRPVAPRGLFPVSSHQGRGRCPGGRGG